MEFASEQERQEWINKENKRVSEANAATLKQSATAVDKHREERDKHAEAESESESEPRVRRGPRPPEGALVSPPAGDDEGDEVDIDELAAASEPFEDEDDEDDED